MAAKALNNRMSRTVRVNRLNLIETLKINRDAHVYDYNEAVSRYKEVALAQVTEAFNGLATRLDKRKAELVEHVNTFSAATAEQFTDRFLILQQLTVDLKVPVSYEDTYDAAIDMATFDTREELDLSGAEFQCFCRDVWDWTYEFQATAMSYTSMGNKK